MHRLYTALLVQSSHKEGLALEEAVERQNAHGDPPPPHPPRVRVRLKLGAPQPSLVVQAVRPLLPSLLWHVTQVAVGIRLARSLVPSTRAVARPSIAHGIAIRTITASAGVLGPVQSTAGLEGAGPREVHCDGYKLPRPRQPAPRIVTCPVAVAVPVREQPIELRLVVAGIGGANGARCPFEHEAARARRGTQEENARIGGEQPARKGRGRRGHAEPTEPRPRVAKEDAVGIGEQHVVAMRQQAKREGGLDEPQRLEVPLLVAHVALVTRQLPRRAPPPRRRARELCERCFEPCRVLRWPGLRAVGRRTAEQRGHRHDRLVPRCTLCDEAIVQGDGRVGREAGHAPRVREPVVHEVRHLRVAEDERERARRRRERTEPRAAGGGRCGRRRGRRLRARRLDSRLVRSATPLLSLGGGGRWAFARVVWPRDGSGGVRVHRCGSELGLYVGLVGEEDERGAERDRKKQAARRAAPLCRAARWPHGVGRAGPRPGTRVAAGAPCWQFLSLPS
eukprot:scaffold19407_cov69-Phaeocystis_antarctica.AAC.2